MGVDESNGGGNQKYTGYDDRFSTYMWNKETKEFFGRTAYRWAQLTIFYVIFYIGLAAFAGLCYFLFQTTLTDERPKWIMDEGLIGSNPGMGYRPMPDPDKNADSTLVWFRMGKETDAKFWYKQLDKYITDVDKRQTNATVCAPGQKATKDRACKVEISKIGTECSKANDFGYTTGEPCFLLKLNRILGWEPDAYGINTEGKADVGLLREDLIESGMPVNLKDYILSEFKKLKSDTEKTTFLKNIWISCDGEGKTDQENVGSFKFHPLDGYQGISSKYFPYYQQSGYTSPFIFVQLVRPQRQVLLNVECKAWTRNIQHDRINRLGSVHFEVMIDT